MSIAAGGLEQHGMEYALVEMVNSGGAKEGTACGRVWRVCALLFFKRSQEGGAQRASLSRTSCPSCRRPRSHRMRGFLEKHCDSGDAPHIDDVPRIKEDRYSSVVVGHSAVHVVVAIQIPN